MKSVESTVELKEMKESLKIHLGTWIQPNLKLLILDIGVWGGFGFFFFLPDLLTNQFFSLFKPVSSGFLILVEKLLIHSFTSRPSNVPSLLHPCF